MMQKSMKHKHLEPASSDESGSDDDVDLFTKTFMSQVKNVRTRVKSGLENMNHESDEDLEGNHTTDTSESDDEEEISRANLVAHKHTRTAQDLSGDSNEDDTSEQLSEDENNVVDKNEDNTSSEEEDSNDEDKSAKNSGSSGQGSDDEEQTEADKQKTVEDSFVQLRKELAELPFNELQKLKEQIGVKAYSEAMFGSQSGRSQRKVFKRENKNRPKEMSSKRTVGRFREVVQVKKQVHRDPRFDDLSGQYNEKLFKHAYSFLDDVKQREKQQLIKRHEKEKDVEKKRQIEQLIKRMNQEEKFEREKAIRQHREAERKTKEKELVKQGKRPYFLKKADEKKLELAEKFKDLKKSGKVENYLAKKRRKTAAKDRRNLPNRHFVFTG